MAAADFDRKFLNRDTIVATATPPGRGAVGMVRLSGPDSARIIGDLCGIDASGLEPRRVFLASVSDPRNRESIDECLVVYYEAPASYTGEDVVEIFAHGNPLILQRICEAAVKAGARPAEPGEFTRRAFLNGKLDLSQAEAVNEMIFASTELSLKAARERLRGGLKHVASGLREVLLEVLVHLEAAVDFPEEEIEIYEEGKISELLEEAVGRIGRLLGTAKVGRILCEGARITICGRPNVGKSRLLNALLGEERAIVSEIPGTTRDFISESVEIGGIPVRMIDTAGIRGTWEDPVEEEGIRRAKREVAEADLVLFVIDGSEPLTGDDDSAFEAVRKRDFVLVVNKLDRGMVADTSRYEADSNCLRCLKVSAKTGEGIEELAGSIGEILTGGRGFLEAEVVVGNVRQKRLLEEALDCLRNALGGLASGAPPELIALDVKEAAAKVGELTGEITTEDVLEGIFSTFCIGK